MVLEKTRRVRVHFFLLANLCGRESGSLWEGRRRERKGKGEEMAKLFPPSHSPQLWKCLPCPCITSTFPIQNRISSSSPSTLFLGEDQKIYGSFLYIRTRTHISRGENYWNTHTTTSQTFWLGGREGGGICEDIWRKMGFFHKLYAAHSNSQCWYTRHSTVSVKLLDIDILLSKKKVNYEAESRSHIVRLTRKKVSCLIFFLYAYSTRCNIL